MKCAAAIIVILAFTVTPLVAQPAAKAQSPRAPWEWSDEERIAARLDVHAAAARLAAHRSAASRQSDGASSSGRTTTSVGKPTVDVIEGRRDPALFFPVELFEAAVRGAFSEAASAFREGYAPALRRAGLPTTFWEHVGVVAAPYLNALKEQDELLHRAGALPKTSADRAAIEARVAAGYAHLCRTRAAALQAVHDEFGVALDRFLYLEVAPTQTVWTDDPWDPNQIRFIERGCQ